MSRRFPWILLATAILVRVLFFQSWTDNPLLRTPVLDARGYASWAAEIEAGHFSWEGVRIHGPGYPFFLAGVLHLVGGDPVLATHANSVLGVAWILLLYFGLRRVSPRPVPEITGLLAAVYWPFLHFEGQLLATTWFLFLLVAAFAVLTLRRSALTVLGAGLLLGAASVTRPTGVAPVPFVAALLLVPAAGAPLGRRVRRTLLLLAGFALPVTPLVVHNWRAGGLPGLQGNTGFNLYLGNAPESPGYVFVRLGSEWDRLADAPRAYGATTPAERDAWFRARVLDHARAHPVAFAGLQVRKLGLFWNRHEIRTTFSPYFFERFAPLQGVLPGFGTIGPLAMVGIFLAFRARPRPWLVAAFALPLMATVVLTVVGSRYRLPAVPFLLPFAAGTIATGASLARSSRPRLAALLAAVLACGVLVNRPVPGLAEDFGAECAHVASALQARGELREAADWWQRSIVEDPGREDAYVGYGALAMGVGDWTLLERLTRQGLTVAPDNGVLLMMRGRALLELGRPEESLAALRPVLPSRPRDPDLLGGIARAHAAAGRADSAMTWFRGALEAAPGRPDLVNDAASLLRRMADSTTDPPTAAALRAEADRLSPGGSPAPPTRPPGPGDARTR